MLDLGAGSQRVEDIVSTVAASVGGIEKLTQYGPRSGSDIYQKLQVNSRTEALNKVFKEPKFIQDMSAGSSVMYFADAAEMDQFLRAENARFKRVAATIDKE